MTLNCKAHEMGFLESVPATQNINAFQLYFYAEDKPFWGLILKREWPG